MIVMGSLGVADIVQESKRPIEELQRADMHALGRLIVKVACKSHAAADQQGLHHSLATIASRFSPRVKDLVLVLLSKPTTVFDLRAVMADRVASHLDEQYSHTAALEAELRKEHNNGRLLLLAIKLGMICDRGDGQAETGAKYALSLFKDYLYHQRGERGEAVVDFGHIIECLNMLDVGAEEEVLLMSRDQQSIIVSSFEELHYH